MAQRPNAVLWKQLFQRSTRENMSLQAQIREMLVVTILDGHLPAVCRCLRAANWPSSLVWRAIPWCSPTSN